MTVTRWLLVLFLLIAHCRTLSASNRNEANLPVLSSEAGEHQPLKQEEDGDDDDHLPATGWTQGQLHCLNLMEDADSNYDHFLNHLEYMRFASTLANRVYGMWTTLNIDQEWQLTELYETLVLLNPSGEFCGIDIKGSAYGVLAKIEDRQEYHLKIICLETKQAILNVGPQW